MSALADRHDLEDRALLRLITARGPIACQQVALAARWQVGPSLIRLERAGLIEWVPGHGYTAAERERIE